MGYLKNTVELIFRMAHFQESVHNSKQNNYVECSMTLLEILGQKVSIFIVSLHNNQHGTCTDDRLEQFTGYYIQEFLMNSNQA